jgi:hypothetical protein
VAWTVPVYRKKHSAIKAFQVVTREGTAGPPSPDPAPQTEPAHFPDLGFTVKA